MVTRSVTYIDFDIVAGVDCDKSRPLCIVSRKTPNLAPIALAAVDVPRCCDVEMPPNKAVTGGGPRGGRPACAREIELSLTESPVPAPDGGAVWPGARGGDATGSRCDADAKPADRNGGITGGSVREDCIAYGDERFTAGCVMHGVQLQQQSHVV